MVSFIVFHLLCDIQDANSNIISDWALTDKIASCSRYQFNKDTYSKF